MTDFIAPVDDILFSLRAAGVEALPGWDADLVQDIVTQFARFAESRIAPADQPGDMQGCTLQNGRVLMPPAMVQAYADFAAQGWQALSLPENAGGQDMPGPVLAAITEIFAGASHALQMVTGLVPGAARTLGHFGSPDQQALWLPRLASGDWLATMALTESNAGSDLSGIRCRAKHDGTGWRVQGEKIFISGGDQNLTPHILHLVLARSGPADSGTRGLSLFLVPSQDDAGHRAPVSVIRIEEKMGLHASPTCQMLYDDAPAELLGPEGEGLRVMFTMMNHARLDVALQGVAHAARAGLIARAYAATRRQGGASLDRHADVRRMLDRAETLAIGARGLCHVAAVTLAAGGNEPLAALLTPVCKVAGTTAGIKAADLAIQILGGYGYLREYRVEQIWRDARITAIYEGTNGIQAMDLVGRKLADQGDAALRLLDEIADGAKAAQADHPQLANQLWQAAETLRDATYRLLERDLPQRFAGAVPYLSAFARVLGGFYHLRAAQAGSADHLALARVFMARVLPRHAADLAEALAGLDDLTGISDAALAGDISA